MEERERGRDAVRCREAGRRREEDTLGHIACTVRVLRGKCAKERKKRGEKTRWCQSSKNIFKPSLSTSDHILIKKSRGKWGSEVTPSLIVSTAVTFTYPCVP